MGTGPESLGTFWNGFRKKIRETLKQRYRQFKSLDTAPRRATKLTIALCLVAGSTLMSACTFSRMDAEGTRHYFIIGAGVVSMPDATNSVVTASKVRALGVMISDIPGPRLVVGYSVAFTVEVDPNVDAALVEIHDEISSPMTVNVSAGQIRSEEE